jgi:hypothetical protein
MVTSSSTVSTTAILNGWFAVGEGGADLAEVPPRRDRLLVHLEPGEPRLGRQEDRVVGVERSGERRLADLRRTPQERLHRLKRQGRLGLLGRSVSACSAGFSWSFFASSVAAVMRLGSP